MGLEAGKGLLHMRRTTVLQQDTIFEPVPPKPWCEAQNVHDRISTCELKPEILDLASLCFLIV